MRSINSLLIKPCILITSLSLNFFVVIGCFAQTPTSPTSTPTATSQPISTPTASPTTNATPAPSSSPSPSPAPKPGFLERTEAAWIGFGGVILGAILAGAFAFWRLQKSLKAQQTLEKEKQNWEIQKLQLEHQLELERMRVETDQERESREAELKEAERKKAEAATMQMRTVEQQAIIYRRKLVVELRNLKILDMSSPLNLENIYVQVGVCEESPPHYVKEGEMKRIAEGEPIELLRRSQISLEELAKIAMPPHDALVKFRRLAILGDPGAGKTTLLRYLALRIAQGKWLNLPNLPVYIELRRFIDSGMGNLLDFAASEWLERYGFANARSYLEQQLNAGQVLLLLDGLDEVLGGSSIQEAQEAYDRVASETNRLAARFPEAYIAVTCRRVGWKGGLTAFQNLEVLDFDWEQIQEFINNWFKATPSKAEGLRQALAGNLRMQTLAANPLILSLIAIVYEQELELPERRAELYKRCVEVLLREWDAKREIKRFSQFTTDRKRDLLEEVAWHFHLTGRRYFPESDLLKLISNFLPTVNIPQQENKAILDEISAQYGLLKKQAHGWYGFLHLTLQEYFTAIAANERGISGLEQVVNHCYSPWWEEVILLLAGRMVDASPLLLGILGRFSSDSVPEDIALSIPNSVLLATNDDFFHSNLLLTARCLVGTPRIRTKGLRERIINDVKRMLLTSPYEFDWDRAARTLVEIGSEALTTELLEMVKDKQIKPPERRAAVVRAFRELGDKSVAQQLLDLLEKHSEMEYSVRWSILYALGALKATFAVPHLLVILEASEASKGSLVPIIQSLGKLGDKSAIPSLLTLLDNLEAEKDSWETDNIKEAIYNALGLLGDNFVVPTLLSNLKSESEESSSFDVPRREIANALGLLGDKTALPELLRLLSSGESLFHIASDIVQAVIKLADESTLNSLIQILADGSTGPSVKVAIADVVKDLRDPSVTELILRLLQDKKIDWESKWLLTECLEGLEEGAREPLITMLNSSDTDKRVKVGIAAALGNWGLRDSIPYLRGAIENQVLPPSWQMGGFTSISRIWGRIARVLKNLDDNSVVPSLVKAWNDRTAEEDMMEYKEPEGILYAVSVYKPEAIARQLLAQIREGNIDHARGYDDILRSLSMFTTKLLISEELTLLQELQLNQNFDFYWNSWGIRSLIDSMAQVADDSEAVTTLLKTLWKLLSNQDTDFTSMIYQKLYSVSKNSGMRVSPDGQIQPLVTL